MYYEVTLLRKDRLIYFKERLLDLCPPNVIDMILDRYVDEEMNICKECEVADHCHILQPIDDNDKPVDYPTNTYRKLCPVLFHDLFKPAWKISELA